MGGFSATVCCCCLRLLCLLVYRPPDVGVCCVVVVVVVVDFVGSFWMLPTDYGKPGYYVYLVGWMDLPKKISQHC